ncbi:MarR family transcriptional regulator [Streptomyces sp. NPDC007818]|uniref:MarR family transcriptional regulator n=1 Tax=Streptomyces sp. NPDC007818 TaxID=3364780 RepID=UPI0036B6CCFD
MTDLTCLGHVLGAGAEPLSAGDLSERANLTTGAVTGVLNRLEKAGYARRVPDPGDRRRVRVVADPAPVSRLTELYQPFYERLGQIFARYSPEETAVIADWFAQAAEAARAHLDTLRGRTAPEETEEDRSVTRPSPRSRRDGRGPAGPGCTRLAVRHGRARAAGTSMRACRSPPPSAPPPSSPPPPSSV